MNEQDLEKLQDSFCNTEFRFRLKDDVIVVDKPSMLDEYGVPLFKGDEYWWVEVEGNTNHHNYTPLYPNSTILSKEDEDKSPFPKTSKIFSCKESAELWIKENKPKQPIYVDPENGDEFFEGDLSYWFDVKNFEIDESENKKHIKFQATDLASKSYNTRKKCELAIMQFIAKKHNI